MSGIKNTNLAPASGCEPRQQSAVMAGVPRAARAADETSDLGRSVIDREPLMSTVTGATLATLMMIALIGAFTGGMNLLLPHSIAPRWYPHNGIVIVSTAIWAGALAVVMMWEVVAFLRRGRSATSAENATSTRSEIFSNRPAAILGRGEICACALLLLYASDFCLRGHGLFSTLPLSRWLPFTWATAAFLIFCARKAPRAIANRISPEPLFLLSICAVAIAFYYTVDGKLLFGDDHPPFLYRLLLLKENFPYVPLYNTDWNGGLSAREFFAAGMLNVFFIALPFVSLLDSSDPASLSMYSYLVGYLFILIVPAAIWLSARLLRLSAQVAATGAILALAPSLALTQYSLKYGTIGFALTSGLVPLALAANIRLFFLAERRTLGSAAAAGVATGLATTWLPMAIAFLPLAAAIAIAALVRRGAPLVHAAVIAAIVLMINANSVKTLFIDVKMDRFLGASTLPGSTTGHLLASTRKEQTSTELSMFEKVTQESRQMLDNLQDQARRTNPLLLVLLLPAFLVRWRDSGDDEASRTADFRRGIYLATAIWLMLLTAVMPEVKPQLELNRLFLPAMFLLCIPAAIALCRMAQAQLDPATRLTVRAFLTGTILGGALLLTVVSAIYCYGNKTTERMTFAPEGLDRFVQLLAQGSGPEKGRVFFLGFILHELGATSWDTQDGGHVALLPALAKVPMYASHFYHVYWSTVDPIPAQFRDGGREGIEKFLDLVNASSVVTFGREWVRYCRGDSRYQELGQFGRFRVFSRASTGTGYFLQGAGQVVPGEPEGIKVQPSTTEVVLKYRYHPRLRTVPAEGVELFNVPMFDEDKGGNVKDPVSYIGVRLSKALPADEWVKIGFYPERIE